MIAGGGVAGLEALLALRELLGDLVELVLLSPAKGFSYRPLAVAEPFGISARFEIDLGAIAKHGGAELRIAALESVDAPKGCVITDGGEELRFDYLVVATGATPQAAVPGALSFDGPDAVAGFERILYRALARRAATGHVRLGARSILVAAAL